MRRQCRQRRDAGRNAAFHVGAAAAVQPLAVPLAGRVARPLRRVADRISVQVPIERHPPARPDAMHARNEVDDLVRSRMQRHLRAGNCGADDGARGLGYRPCVARRVWRGRLHKG